MFNIYQFERQARQDPKLQQKWVKERSTKSLRRKSDTAARDRMVSGYKSRVTSFIKDMTVAPVTETDFYGKGFEQASHAQKMVGPPRMAFGALKSDHQRLQTAVQKNSYIDSVPTDPEWQVWKMRPRQKSKEIGPSMRFNSHFQAERLMDQLKNQTQTFFTRANVTGDGNQPQELEKRIKAYNKTGKFQVVGRNPFDADNSNCLSNSMAPSPTNVLSFAQSPKSTRQSRLQKSNYFVEPRLMMKNIHQKTHFKAAISVSRGDACCLKVGQNEFGDQFAEIARNIESLNRSSNDFNPAQKASTVGDWLRENRNCRSQGRQRRIRNDSMVNANQGAINRQTNSQMEQADADDENKFDANKIDPQEWEKLTPEEKDAIRMMKSSTDISPEQVTNQVLKLCNVVRQRQDVLGTGVYMRKRSGLGGSGGRHLSPDLKIRFGTFGFKKTIDAQRQSLPKVFGDERAKTIQVLTTNSGRNHHSSHGPRRNVLSGSQYEQTLKDMIETNDSTQGPPNVTTSVDMGMCTDDSPSGSTGTFLTKKKVVLKKAELRYGSLNPKLIKSLTQQQTSGQYSQVSMSRTHNEEEY